MRVHISPQPFDPLDELRRYEDALGERRRAIGAAATFVGTMRDFNEGAAVESMVLEHYPEMTQKHLERIVSTAVERWALDDALVVHRVGEVRPGDAIVLVAVWSAHRAHAFESCRFIMEEIFCCASRNWSPSLCFSATAAFSRRTASSFSFTAVSSWSRISLRSWTFAL